MIKYVAAIIVWSLFLYLSSVFIAVEFNPLHWLTQGRFIFVMAWVAGSLISIAAVIDMEDRDK